MKTLLPNVNTSEGCFEIGVTISNPVFTEDAINKRKHERKRQRSTVLTLIYW
nr:cell division inhibition protein DicB [Escherichia coli]